MKHARLSQAVILGILFCMLAGLLLGGTGCEQTMTYFKILPSETTVSPGETFAVDVTLEPAPAHAVAGVQFDLSFNSTLLQAESVSEGTLLGESCSGTFFRGGTIDNESGTITAMVGVITNPGCTVSATGTLATITFTALSETGTAQLLFRNTKVGDANGTNLAHVGYTATVEVTAP